MNRQRDPKAWPEGFGPFRRGLRVLPVVLASLVLLSCSQKDPYVPPDLLYLFSSYRVGKNPTSVSTGDFNADGITDIVTTNIGNNSISLLFGNGDGTFREQVIIPTCQEPRSHTLGDYNQDGFVDMAVACSGSDLVRILFGHETGILSNGPNYAMHRTPVALAGGDINNDQKEDLLVAMRNDKLQVLLGRGNGSFQKGAEYEYGDTPTSVALKDLDGDGMLDAAVANGGPMTNGVSIWLGNGDGTFQDPTDYRTGKRPLAVRFADFNNDLKTDMLVINMQQDSFTVFLGNGNGTFQEGKDDGADAGPVFGLTRDFNGDRLTDVAIVNTQSRDLSILFGRGDGTFRYPPRNYKTEGRPFAIANLILTKNAEGEPGLVIANNGASSVSVFLHRGLRHRRHPASPHS